MNYGKRIMNLFLAAVLVLTSIPGTAFAQTSQQDSLCPQHHPEHTAECGYREAVEGHACSHECTQACFREITSCIHTHGSGSCTYVPEVAGSDCTCGEEEHSSECGYRAAVAASGTCSHTSCTVESGCVKTEKACVHSHDNDCQFVEAVQPSPCSLMPCAQCVEQSPVPEQPTVPEQPPVQEKTAVDFLEYLDEEIPVIFQSAADLDMHDYLVNAFDIDVPFTCSPATVPYGKYADGETFALTVTAAGDYEGSCTVTGEVRYLSPAVISRVLSVKFVIKEKGTGAVAYSHTIAPRNSFNAGVENLYCSALDSGKEYEMTVTFGETKYSGYDHIEGRINSITAGSFSELTGSTVYMDFAAEGTGGSYASTGSAKCTFKSDSYGKYTITVKMDNSGETDKTRQIDLTLTFRGSGKEEDQTQTVIAGSGIKLTPGLRFPGTVLYNVSWSKDGVPIPGATETSYTPEQMKPGEVYVATISRKPNEYGCTGTESWTCTFTVSNEEMILPMPVTGLVYNGTAQKIFTDGSASGYVFMYFPEGFNGIVPYPYDFFWEDNQYVNAGTYRVYYQMNTGFGTGIVKSGYLDCTIAKATPVVTASPAAVSGLIYSGNPQTLITGGTASGGTMQYSLNNSSWSNNLPSATDAGTYTVYYRINGDANHNTVKPSDNSVTVTIAPKETPVVTAPTAKRGLVYNGTAQELLATSGQVTSGGSLVYALTTSDAEPAAGAYTSKLPTATEAGTYRVWYKVAGNNYRNNTPASIAVSVGKATAVLTSAPTVKDLTYTGMPQELINPGSASLGTVVYAVTETSVNQAPESGYTQTIPARTDAGVYRVWFRIESTDSIVGVAARYVDVSIKKAQLTVMEMTAKKFYDGTGSTDTMENLQIVFSGIQNEETLTMGTDFTVTGLTLAAKNGGYDAADGYVLTADIALTDTAMAGNYTLSNGVGFTGSAQISPVSITEVVIADLTNRTFNRTPHTPDIQATYLELPELVKDTDYSLAYANNVNAGQATVTVTGKGNYTGNRDVTFVINPAELAQAWLSCSYDPETPFVYNAGKQVPVVTVDGGAVYGVLSETDDYTVTYNGVSSGAVASPTNVDRYTVTVTGKGNYRGTLTAEFQIVPLAVTITPDANQNKVYGATEPALTYSVNPAIPAGQTLNAPLQRQTGENAGTYTITLTTASGNPNYILTLAEGTHTFTITPLELTETNTEVTASDLLYNGKEQNLTPTVKVTLPGGANQTLESADITVTGNKGTGIGSYEMTLTGRGNFTGTLNVTRKIVPDGEVLTAVLDGTITPDNVSLTQQEALETLKNALDSVTEDTNATAEELAQWEEAKEKLADILQKLDALNAALNTEEYQAAIQITPGTVAAGDKTTLEEAKKDIQAYLYGNAGNITDAEKTKLEEQIGVIDLCLAEIEKAQSTIEEVQKWLKDNKDAFEADNLELREEWKEMDEKIQKLPENVRRIAKGALDTGMNDAKSKLYTYTITGSNGSRWVRGSSKGMEFKANGHIDLFVEVLIDGVRLDPSKYEVKSGSTIITLKRSYMASLRKGEHTIEAVYTDGQTESYTFRIVAQTSNSGNPKTGDQILAAVAVMALSGAAAGLLIWLKKRKK